MYRRLILLLCACNSACADLPPVSGNPENLTPDPALNAAKSSASATANYELMKRLEQLQTEVQQLTGKVEEQVYQIEELKKQQKTMYTDFDDRIQSLETKSPSGSDQPAPAGDAGSSPAESGAGDSAAPMPAEPAPAAAEPQSGIKPAESVDKQTKVISSAQPAAPQPSPPASESETREYQQAYEALRNGKTDEAISGFNAYITNHPNGAYASNSQYWLGEAYRVNQDNTAARKAFNDVVEQHPGSAKVPDALLKLGYIEMEEKNPEKAREYFTRITSEYGSSKAARLAEKKLPLLEASNN